MDWGMDCCIHPPRLVVGDWWLAVGGWWLFGGGWLVFGSIEGLLVGWLVASAVVRVHRDAALPLHFDRLNSFACGSSVMCCFFGLFDPDDEGTYVEELVVDLLADESVNIAAMPDTLERPLAALRSAGGDLQPHTHAHGRFAGWATSRPPTLHAVFHHLLAAWIGA